MQPTETPPNIQPTAQHLFQRVLDIALRLGILILVGSWCYQIIRPFAVPVLWGIIIAIAGHPFYMRLFAVFRSRRSWAATSFVLILLALFLVPAALLTDVLLDSTRKFAHQLQLGTVHVPPPPAWLMQRPLLAKYIAPIWAKAATDLSGLLQSMQPQLQNLGHWLLSALANTGMSLLQFFAAIIVSGFLLANEHVALQASNLLMIKLAGTEGPRFASIAASTIRSVTRGVLGVAVLQSLLAGIAFFLVGIPAAAVWAMLCLLLSILQVGLLPILIPLVIYVFYTSSLPIAIAFTVWCVLVGTVDNVLKPLMLGRGVEVPLLVVFIGTIGGLLAWGLIGLFVGSVGLVVGYRIFNTWLNATQPQV